MLVKARNHYLTRYINGSVIHVGHHHRAGCGKSVGPSCLFACGGFPAEPNAVPHAVLHAGSSVGLGLEHRRRRKINQAWLMPDRRPNTVVSLFLCVRNARVVFIYHIVYEDS